MIIGREMSEITDPNRKETFSEVDENRRFMISVFYPTQWQGDNGNAIPYIDLFSPQSKEAYKIFLNMGANEKHLQQLQANFNHELPINDEKHPIILYSPGGGVDRDMYLFNIEKLVSEGYIVVTVGATYDTLFTVFPNGEVVHQSETMENLSGTDFDTLRRLVDIRKQDLKFVLDTLEKWNEEDDFLKGKLDLERISVIGHSLGGATVYELAKEDERIRAGVILDGSLHLLSHHNKTTTPFLNIRQGKSSYEEMLDIMGEEIAAAYSIGQAQLFDDLEGAKHFVKIHDSDHMSFSDVPWIYNDQDDQLDSIKQIHEVINQLTTAFFSEYLSGEEARFTSVLNDYSNVSLIDQYGQVVTNQLK